MSIETILFTIVSDGPDNSTSIVKITSTSAVEGESYSLNCSADCVPACNISWRFSGSDLQSTGVLVIDKLNRSDAGTYVCTSTNYLTNKTGSDSTEIDVICEYQSSTCFTKVY